MVAINLEAKVREIVQREVAAHVDENHGKTTEEIVDTIVADLMVMLRKGAYV